MRTFKWTPEFRPDVESSIAPAWVPQPNLPLFLFNKTKFILYWYSLGQAAYTGAATAEISRPNVARMCVEVYLLK